MNDFKYAMNTQIVPLVSPVDAISVDQATVFLPAKLAVGSIQFLIPFGTITGSDTNQVTLEACTAADTSGGATEITVPFTYRLSGAVGSDSWGAVTTADSTGVAITGSDDDKILLIDYDPATNPDYGYVRCAISPGSAASACELAVIGIFHPKYGQLDQISST